MVYMYCNPLPLSLPFSPSLSPSFSLSPSLFCPSLPLSLSLPLSQSNKEKAIKECKVPRKSGKCGVIPSVREFMRFAEKAESIVMGTDRRSDLDKAYKILINALFDSINRLSEEHPKTPRSVVLLGKGREREREREREGEREERRERRENKCNF